MTAQIRNAELARLLGVYAATTQPVFADLIINGTATYILNDLRDVTIQTYPAHRDYLRFDATYHIGGTYQWVNVTYQTVAQDMAVAGVFQPLDPTLTSLAAYNSNGLITQTAADTFVGRTIEVGAGGYLGISNGNGVAGNPIISLVDADLIALADLAATAGFLSRTGAGAFAVRTLGAPAAGLTISNPTGAAGNPAFALANDLAALEGLSSTGIPARTGTDTWSVRTITEGNGIEVVNGNGVSGNPVITQKDLISPFLSLPGLRGFWSMGSFDANGNAIDLSGVGSTLSLVTVTTDVYSYSGLVPFANTQASGYFARADNPELSITGAEALIPAASRGLTMGGWFRFTDFSNIVGGLICKDDGGTNKSYFIRISNPSGSIFNLVFNIDQTGNNTTINTLTHTTNPTTGVWYFIVARYDPSTEMKLWMNTTSAVNAVTDTTGIPSSIFNGTAAFEVGRMGMNNNFLNYGDMSNLFISCMYLSDDIITNLYEHTRYIYAGA